MYKLWARFMSLSQLLFFKAPIFPKLTTAQRYHVEISCIEFHPNRSGNMESAGRDSFTPSSEVCLSLSRSARTFKLIRQFLQRTPISNFRKIPHVVWPQILPQRHKDGRTSDILAFAS